MSIPCSWYVLVLLTCTHRLATTGFVDQEEQIERPKELLRHQQNHRPSFIYRKLEMREATESLANLADQDDGLSNENDSETNQPTHREKLETSIEKPVTQIRHGRSRNHFTRQAKIDDLELLHVSSSTGRRAQITENTSYSENVSRSDKSRTKGPGSDESSNQGSRSSGSIGERSTVDLDKLLTRLSDVGRKEGKPRNTSSTRHRNDSLNKLRKVTARNRSRLFGNRTGNLTEVYGHIVHGAPINDRSDLDDLEMAILEDYDVYSENNVRNGSEPEDYEDYEKASTDRAKIAKEPVHVDIVTRFLRIIENQHLLGENCTAGTDLNLGEGIVDQYAQERFRLEANLAVNRANMLTRLWKYAPEVMLSSEYLLHASILSMVEFDEDIFAAGNCYDKLQYKDRWLYCPFAHRLQDQDGILVKDLAIEYKYLSNSSEWFYIARKNAERVIANNDQFSRGE